MYIIKMNFIEIFSREINRDFEVLELDCEDKIKINWYVSDFYFDQILVKNNFANRYDSFLN